MIYINEYDSPLGRLLLGADEAGLTGLRFAEGDRYVGRGLGEDAVFRQREDFDRTKRWLDLYFSRRDPGFLPRLHLIGTDFQRRVWALLLEIPYGQTATYGDLARRLGGEPGRMAPRAVGGAVGRNPISILVPCHRVLGAGGRLTGYAGGLPRKIALLELEGAAAWGQAALRLQ